MARKIWISAPKSMIAGWRIWVEENGARRELSQVNGDGHGAAFRSAFDSETRALRAARKFYRSARAAA